MLKLWSKLFYKCLIHTTTGVITFLDGLKKPIHKIHKPIGRDYVWYGNLTGRSYLQFLEGAITHRIVAAIENDVLTTMFRVPVREYIHEEFAGCWIRRRRYTEWSSPASHRAPLDVCIQTDVCVTITPEILANLRQNLEIGSGDYCQDICY